MYKKIKIGLVLLVGGLVLSMAKPTFAQKLEFSDEELAGTPLPPSLYARTFRLPIFNVDTGGLRFVIAFRGIARQRLRAILQDHTAKAGSPLSNAPIFRTPREGSIDCDCAGALEAGEFVISETPVRDSQLGKYVSLNDESYKALMELSNFPLEDDATISVSFSELVYTYNARAIARFLDARGFDLVHSYGFMDSPTYPGKEDTQFVLIKERRSGRFIIAIRGTSGVLDLKTNVNATMEPWRGEGAVHSGFNQTMEIIATELAAFKTLMTASGQPVLVLGHSLGGAASILLTLAAAKSGMDYYAISYAPPPIGDRTFESAYQNVGKVLVNFFLPGEEMDTVDKPKSLQWMRLVGEKQYLEDVGKTAGATHFVINYLKGILKRRGGDVREYEHSLPVCVLEKFYCFDSGVMQFVPMCLFENWACMTKATDLVLGLEPGRNSVAGHRIVDDEIVRRLTGKPSSFSRKQMTHLKAKLKLSKKLLLGDVPSDRVRHLMLLRTTLFALLTGGYDEASRFLSVLKREGQDGLIVNYFSAAALAMGKHSSLTKAAVTELLESNPPAEIVIRAKLFMLAGRKS